MEYQSDKHQEDYILRQVDTRCLRCTKGNLDDETVGELLNAFKEHGSLLKVDINDELDASKVRLIVDLIKATPSLREFRCSIKDDRQCIYVTTSEKEDVPYIFRKSVYTTGGDGPEYRLLPEADVEKTDLRTHASAAHPDLGYEYDAKSTTATVAKTPEATEKSPSEHHGSTTAEWQSLDKDFSCQREKDSSTPIDTDAVRQWIKAFPRTFHSSLDIWTFEHLLREDIQEAIRETGTKVADLRDELLLADDDDVREFCQVVAGLYPETFKLMTNREPTDSESDHCLGQFIGDLKQAIQKNYKGPAAFVEPRLVEMSCSSDGKGTMDIELKDIVAADRSSVIICGNGGIGKTTLANWSVLQWSQATWASEHSVVFLLDMQSLATNKTPMTLVDLLTKYAVYKPQNHHPEFVHWLINNGKKIIIWFDCVEGLSPATSAGIGLFPGRVQMLKERLRPKTKELRWPKDPYCLADPLTWVISILKGKVLPDCFKIMTMRSAAMLTEIEPDYAVEILGLMPKQVKGFIHKNIPEEKRVLVEQTLLCDDVLMSMCDVPMWCSKVCDCLLKGTDPEGKERNTYTRMACFLILELISSHGSKQSKQQNLQSVTKLAGKELIRQHTTKTPVTTKLIGKLKVSPSDLKAPESSCLLTYRPTVNEGGKTIIEARMAHSIACEILGMACLGRLGCETILLQVPERARLFLFGLAFDCENQWVKRLKESVGYKAKDESDLKQKMTKVIKTFLEKGDVGDTAFRHEAIRTAYECQSEEVAKAVAQKMVLEKGIKLSGVPLTVTDMRALAFVMKHEEKLTALELTDAQVNDATLEALRSSVSKKLRLEEISLRGNHITDNGISSLKSIIRKSPNLRGLDASDNDFTDTGLKNLCKELRRNTSLKELFLEKSNITDAGLFDLRGAQNTSRTPIKVKVTSRTGALNKKLADELFDPGPKGEAVHPGSEGSRDKRQHKRMKSFDDSWKGIVTDLDCSSLLSHDNATPQNQPGIGLTGALLKKERRKTSSQGYGNIGLEEDAFWGWETVFPGGTDSRQTEAGGPDSMQTETGGPDTDSRQTETGGPVIDSRQTEAGGPDTDSRQTEAGGPDTDSRQTEAGGPDTDIKQTETGGPDTDSRQTEAGGPDTDSRQTETGGPVIDSRQTEAGGPDTDTDSRQTEVGGPVTDIRQTEAGGPDTDSRLTKAGGPDTDSRQTEAGGPDTDSRLTKAGGPDTDSRLTEAGGPDTDIKQTEVGGPDTDSMQRVAGGPDTDSMQTEGGGPKTRHVDPGSTQPFAGSSAVELRCRKGLLSAAAAQRLQFALTKHGCLDLLQIDHNLEEGYLEPLLNFMNTRPSLKEIRTTTRENKVYLEVLKSDGSKHAYHPFENGARRDFLSTSELLQEKLQEWLHKQMIPSAIDTVDKKLTLFIPKSHYPELNQAVESRLEGINPIYKDAVKVVSTDELEIQEENRSGKCSLGCQIVYHDSEQETRHATCGGFVKDQNHKIYALSSCHGNMPDECYILESVSTPLSQKRHPCEFVEQVYQKSPLVDAVLFDVTEGVPRNIIDPHLPEPGPNSSLVGPFRGSIEDLHLSMSDISSVHLAKGPEVMKYGGETQLTKGVLSFYRFNIPQDEITNALVISPQNPCEEFSKEGDCGSVIFRENRGDNQPSGEAFSYEGLALLCYGLKGLKVDEKSSLAFRLDHAIERLEDKTGKKLSFLPMEHS